MDDLRRTEALASGDACEFRYPARSEWRRGTVEHNGGGGLWSVRDTETGRVSRALYIEHVRAVGSDPWGASGGTQGP